MSTLYKPHGLVFSVTVFTALLGSGFQQRTFPFHRTVWLSADSLDSRLGLVMEACTRYIFSARTAQKTPNPTSFIVCVSVTTIT